MSPFAVAKRERPRADTREPGVTVRRLDADIEFLEKDVVDETIHALQHHPVVQMFQTCVDMGPKGEVMKVHTSFGYCHKTAQPFSGPRGVYPSNGFRHPCASPPTTCRSPASRAM